MTFSVQFFFATFCPTNLSKTEDPDVTRSQFWREACFVSKSSFRYHPPFCFLNVLPSPSSTLVTGMLDDRFRLAHLQGLEACSLSPTPQHSSTQTQSNWTQLPQHVTVRASRTSLSGATIHSKSGKVCGFCFSVSTNLQKKGKRKKCVNRDNKISWQKCVNQSNV